MFHSHKPSSSNLKNITPKDTIVSVSSTLDAKSGKKYLLDGSDETCWSSAQSLPQHISLAFPTLLPATHISLTFQGGFSGTSIAFYLTTQRPGKQTEEILLSPIFGGYVYPEDKNGRQVFEIPVPEAVVPPLPNSVATAAAHGVSGTSAGPPQQQQDLVRAAGTNGNGGGGGRTGGTAQAAVEVGREAKPEQPWIKELKLVFEKSADPWGRIVVYDVQILG